MRLDKATPLLVGLLMLTPACSEDPTEIVLTVDSDIPLLAGVEASFMREGEGTLDTRPLELPLPRTVVLRHEGGALGPVVVTLVASSGASSDVTRTMSMFFEEGETLRYDAFLSGTCADVDCGMGETCEAGLCRDEGVRPCEFAGRTCDPPPDAGMDTAPIDAPIDGGVDCPLNDGICGVSGSHAPGDRLTPSACGGNPEGMIIEWSAIAPDASEVPNRGAPDAPSYRLGSALGTYAIRASVPGMSTCMRELTTMVVGFVEVGTAMAAAGSNPRERRDIDARMGRAFLATRDGPYTVSRSQDWTPLVGTTGEVVSDDLSAVAVYFDRVYFGASGSEDWISEVAVAPNLSTIEYSDVVLPGGSRSVRAMDAPGDSSMGALVVSTNEGPLTIDAAGSMATPRGMGFDANADIAIGTREGPGRAAIWGVRSDRIQNFTSTSVGEFNGGSATSTDPWTGVNAVEVADADEATARLWLCDGLANGVAVFDLGTDWSTLTALPAPIRRSGTCLDIDLDEGGDAWVADGSNVVRYDADGNVVSTLDAAIHMLGASPAQVAVTWDAANREVWVLDDDGAVHMLASDLAL